MGSRGGDVTERPWRAGWYLWAASYLLAAGAVLWISTHHETLATAFRHLLWTHIGPFVVFADPVGAGQPPLLFTVLWLPVGVLLCAAVFTFLWRRTVLGAVISAVGTIAWLAVGAVLFFGSMTE